MSNTICHCKMVTDKEILSAITKGATTLTEIMEFTGAGTGCGRCKPQIGEILLTRQKKEPPYKQLRLALFQ